MFSYSAAMSMMHHSCEAKSNPTFLFHLTLHGCLFCLYLIGAVLQSLLLHFVSLCQGFHVYKKILIKKFDRIGPNNPHPSTKKWKIGGTALYTHSQCSDWKANCEISIWKNNLQKLPFQFVGDNPRRLHLFGLFNI